MKIIEVVVSGVNYAIYFNKGFYHFTENNELVFMDANFEKVREKLFDATGV